MRKKKVQSHPQPTLTNAQRQAHQTPEPIPQGGFDVKITGWLVAFHVEGVGWLLHGSAPRREVS